MYHHRACAQYKRMKWFDRIFGRNKVAIPREKEPAIVDAIRYLERDNATDNDLKCAALLKAYRQMILRCGEVRKWHCSLSVIDRVRNQAMDYVLLEESD